MEDEFKNERNLDFVLLVILHSLEEIFKGNLKTFIDIKNKKTFDKIWEDTRKAMNIYEFFLKAFLNAYYNDEHEDVVAEINNWLLNEN